MLMIFPCSAMPSVLLVPQAVKIPEMVVSILPNCVIEISRQLVGLHQAQDKSEKQSLYSFLHSIFTKVGVYSTPMLCCLVWLD